MESLREKHRRACAEFEAHEQQRRRQEQERSDVSIVRVRHPDPDLDVIWKDVNQCLAVQERLTKAAKDRCNALAGLLQRIDRAPER